MRFVADPEKRVVPDLKRKLPGRGVWITATRDAIAKAVRQKVFARGFRQAVEVDANLTEAVEILLRRAALQNLALANKAGCVVAGFAKVEKALSGRKPIVLLHASDAASDGRRKLDRLAQALRVKDSGAEANVCSARSDEYRASVDTARSDKHRAPVGCFTSAEVSAALGRENVMHAAIEDDGAGRRFLRSAERFRRYVGTHPGAASVTAPSEQDKE